MHHSYFAKNAFYRLHFIVSMNVYFSPARSYSIENKMQHPEIILQQYNINIIFAGTETTCGGIHVRHFSDHLPLQNLLSLQSPETKNSHSG